MSEKNGKKPHFNYEEVVAWERALRAQGFFCTIGKDQRGHNITHISLKLSLNPGDPLPLLVPFEMKKDPAV